jgi:translation elongation factor EF-G
MALESIVFPETVISMAIEPESSNDRKKLDDTLKRLERQDPTFRVKSNPETGQTIISGMGELHLGSDSAPHGARFQAESPVSQTASQLSREA